MNFYTGIGSRQTPIELASQIRQIAIYMASHGGWHLRSGHAPGADTWFEEGCVMGCGSSTIYLPWRGFNGSSSPAYLDHFTIDVLERARSIAEEFHPAWNKCNRGVRALHTRNVFQILGDDLATPSELVICWSPGKGGTEQALRIARAYNIPIYNLYKP